MEQIWKGSCVQAQRRAVRDIICDVARSANLLLRVFQQRRTVSWEAPWTRQIAAATSSDPSVFAGRGGNGVARDSPPDRVLPLGPLLEEDIS